MGFPERNLLYGGVSESRRGQDKDRWRWWSVRVAGSAGKPGRPLASAWAAGSLDLSAWSAWVAWVGSRSCPSPVSSSPRGNQEVGKSGKSALCVTFSQWLWHLDGKTEVRSRIKLSSPHNSFILEFWASHVHVLHELWPTWHNAMARWTYFCLIWFCCFSYISSKNARIGKLLSVLPSALWRTMTNEHELKE